MKERRERPAAGTTTTMNDDLRQWIPKDDHGKTTTTIETSRKKTRPTGKCHVCNTNEATEICIKCGAPTCPSCYLTMIGLCQQCLSKETVDKWKNRKTNWKKLLDVDWID